MLRDITPIVFCSSANDWVPVPDAIMPLPEGGTSSESARISTFNILADCWPFFIELVICSKLRYRWLTQELKRLDATVLCLNEATLSAIEYIMEDPFVRTNYYVSEWGQSASRRSINGTLQKHGCFILSKMPFQALSAFSWGTSATKNNREAIVAKLTICGGSTVVCATHCSHRQREHQKRELQVAELKQSVESHPDYKATDALFVLGDLNMYSNSEDGVILSQNMLDLWAETHFADTAPFNDNDPGYTFDSQANHMIPRYVPGHTRRIRLDRILLRKNSMLKPRTACKLWANEAIDPDHLEVFPSDHFGLVIDVERAAEPMRGNAVVAGVLESNAQESPVRHRRSLYSNTVGIGAHCAWLLGRYVGAV